MQPFKGIPGFKGIHGYLELNDSKGLLHIADNDGMDIYFPKSYRDYLSIKKSPGDNLF